MLKPSSLPAPLRSLSIAQRLLIGIVALVVIFLFIGTLLQPATPGAFSFGIQTQPFLVLAFLSFAGGLLSFISPCTLPILTAYFAFAFQSERQRIASNTLAFMFGLGITFSLLGALGFALGRVLLQNQQLILLIGGSFILVFGVMSLLGKGFGGVTQTGPQLQNSSTSGSFFFGLTFAVGWSSCVGPILGSVLTMAAQTASVWHGMMLLFIYTLGLGLPLLIVSTFFGRMSRRSAFWRILRGKGWTWDTHMFLVALVWALAAWRILVALAQHAFRTFPIFAGQSVTGVHEYGLLVIAILGAALWVITSPGERRTTIHLHTTQLVSGALFILMGILMLEMRLAAFNNLMPVELAEWLARQEEWLIGLFTR